MRFIVYGVGAVGGVLAAALADRGHEVIGIARGAQLEAIRKDGLTLRAPEGDLTARFDCVAHPSEITFRQGDLILLCMKTQNTPAALQALRAAGVQDQAIFCCQNGVTNEDLALRFFPNVHGVTVMMPCTYLEAGKVVTWVTPKFGLFDVGRYPKGVDDADRALVAALNASGCAGFVAEHVMRQKYGKLLLNVGNGIQAALGRDQKAPDLYDMARAEAEAVYRAAGIDWADAGDDDPRREVLIRNGDVPGEARVGGSTYQSLMRGLDSVETDYLNGEIVRLGRLHGVSVPVNEGLMRLADELSRQGAKPGTLTPEALRIVLGVA